jgi:maltodextrin utilization protein YvdJ
MYNKNKNNLIMLILYLVFSIIVWVLPAQIETKLVFQIFMTLMWAYFFIHVFNHQKKLIKTNEGVPALSNLQN